MPVTSQHPQYTERLEDWQLCRDAADGAKAVKARAEQYLPRLGGQDDTEYRAYSKRALWYGATGRTIQGLLGAVFRKAPTFDVPATIEPHTKDITMTGVDLPGFCKQALAEVLKVGRFGILVDMGQDEAATQRPYWIGYGAEQIVNWATTQQHGDTVLTMVVLYEDAATLDPADPFSHKTEPQYRVLKLDQGRYVVEIWQRQKDKDEWIRVNEIVPMMRGAALPFIPFAFIGPNDVTTAADKPPLLDLAEVNMSHYRSSADLEHGCHFTALPTPWVAGFPTDTVLKIGSSIAWVSTDPNASAGMLEFTGDGLGTLERAMDRKERLMAILGARMLDEQKKAVEAADTHEMRAAGEHSVLSSICGTVEAAVRNALTWHSKWVSLSETEPTVELNKEFFEARMSPTELAELVKTWQSGAISQETLYWNMERGALTRPGVKYQEEQRLIEQSAPARLPLADSNPAAPLS